MVLEDMTFSFFFFFLNLSYISFKQSAVQKTNKQMKEQKANIIQ